MAGFTNVLGAGGGGSNSLVLPVTQTINGSGNTDVVHGLGASFEVCNVRILSSTGVNINMNDWEIKNNTTITVINYAGAVTNAKIYIFYKRV